MKIKLTRNYYWDNMNCFFKLVSKIFSYPHSCYKYKWFCKITDNRFISWLLEWHMILYSQIFPIEDYTEKSKWVSAYLEEK
jgi:hypothetical protein